MKNMLWKGKRFVWDILFQSWEDTEQAPEAMYVLTESDSDGNRDHIPWWGLSLGLGLILWCPEETQDSGGQQKENP